MKRIIIAGLLFFAAFGVFGQGFVASEILAELIKTVSISTGDITDVTWK